jgi:citrate synthase
MMMTASAPLVTTALSLVDGTAGVLAFRGVRLEDAVRHPYAVVATLLLTGATHGHEDVAYRLTARPLPASIVDGVRRLGPLSPMARLRCVAAALEAMPDDDDVAWAGSCVRAVAGLGPQATTTAAAQRPQERGFAAAVLAGVSADVDDESVALLDSCFVVHLDHALNPSTLAVRVAASAGSSLSACFGVGLGTLEGPLHGGASTAVGALLEQVAHPDAVEAMLDDHAGRRQRIPGFGHPVYRTRDPRAAVLRALCERAARHRRQHRFLDTALRIEEWVGVRSQGRLFPNVDFYAAALYATLGVPLAWHTPLFFAARALGWVAHIREQRARGRVLSPDAGYDGPPLVPPSTTPPPMT